MKLFFTILLLLPTYLFAQDITGVWTGTLTTSEKKLPYEVVISDSSGRLVGYSHITFTVKGAELIAVKKVSITNDNGVITIEDEELISNNLTEAQPKRIMQTDNLVLHIQDSTMLMIGTFKTKKIVGMRQGSGEVMLQKKRPSDTSKLMAKLNELNLTSSLSFLQLKKETGKVVTETVAAAPSSVTNNSLASRKALPAAPEIITKPIVKDTPIVVVVKPIVKDTPIIAIAKPIIITKPPVVVVPKPKDTIAVAVVTPKVVKPTPTVVAPTQKPVAVVKQPVVIKLPVIPQPKPKEVKTVVVAPGKKVAKPPVEVAVKQTTTAKASAVAPPAPKPVVVAPPRVQPKPDNIPAGAASDIANRKIETIETLTIESDSIIITLYDNGYVDGDTVSILLNNKVIMGKVGLSTHPVTKTVYVTQDLGDSLQFVMYAENLGSIPPNTGLMILQDGKKRYEIFFSGDLTKNAAITLRKKKPADTTL